VGAASGSQSGKKGDWEKGVGTAQKTPQRSRRADGRSELSQKVDVGSRFIGIVLKQENSHPVPICQGESAKDPRDLSGSGGFGRNTARTPGGVQNAPIAFHQTSTSLPGVFFGLVGGTPTNYCYTSQKSRGIGCENGELKSGVINVPREESERAFCSQKAIQAIEGGAKGQSRGKRNKCRRPRAARYAGLPLDGTAAPRTTPVGNSIFLAPNVRNPRDDNPVKSATRYRITQPQSLASASSTFRSRPSRFRSKARMQP
jgi:hypothetical protein